MSHSVHLQLLSRLWVWCSGMWCWSSLVKTMSLEPGIIKHSLGCPPTNSHFILTVRPVVLFLLSVAPHPFFLKQQQPGRDKLAYSFVVQANDLHMTLELERSIQSQWGGSLALRVTIWVSERGKLVENHIPVCSPNFWKILLPDKSSFFMLKKAMFSDSYCVDVRKLRHNPIHP